MKDAKLIYLHIGLHKTATTTIQVGLKLNVGKLLEDGYCYPRSGLIGDAHHNLVWDVAQGDVLPWDNVIERTSFSADHGGFEALFKELQESPAERVIISSEAFENLSPKRVFELKERLKEYNVRIVVYLRNQPEYYQSAWAQHIKFGLTTDDFVTWLDKTLSSTADYLACFGDYEALLTNWSDVFGRENIIVELFENGQKHEHVFVRFLDSCGISNHIGYELPGDQNVAPGIKTLELMRQVNKILLPNKKLPAYFYLSLVNYNKRHSWDVERISILSTQLSDKICAFFSESNREVALNYFGKESLFEKKTIVKFNNFDINQISQSELLQIIVETFLDLVTTREKENKQLYEHYLRVISDMGQKLNQAEQKLNVTEQKLSVIEQKLNQAEQKLSVTEQKLSVTEQKLNVTEKKLSVIEQKLSQSEQKLSLTEQKLDQAEQKLSLTEQKFINFKSDVVFLQRNLNRMKTRSLNVANELAGMRESRISRLVERFRRFDILQFLNPAFQLFLDDSYLFQNVKGFLLQPSTNFQKKGYLGYRLELNRPGLCGIWIAPLLDIPLQQGVVGVELVSPENKIVVQQVVSVSDLQVDMPGHFIFEPVFDTQQGVWEIRIFARDVEGPIRLVEWRKYALGGLGRLKTRAFFGFDFS